MQVNKRRVLVGMSGGVDSSVAAALLCKAGYEVVGVTLLMISTEHTLRAQKRVHQVATRLGVHHLVLDCRQAFVSEVLGPCWEYYSKGQTPNPCVFCNTRVKFSCLLKLADILGVKRIATGHYARIEFDPIRGPILTRGYDTDKDQSYFLFALERRQLERTLFPIGSYTKAKIRALAHELELPWIQERESQDMCIAYKRKSFAETLRCLFAGRALRGVFVNSEGKVLGEHAGLHRYTIGQRSSLGIALGSRAWVCDIRRKDNAVVLTTQPEALFSSTLQVGDVRWGTGNEAFCPGYCHVQIRSRHQPARAKVECLDKSTVHAVFDKPQRAIAPGQAAVFYDKQRVIGGGRIISQ